MTSELLTSTLRALGIVPYQTIIADTQYSLPTADWIAGDFARAFRTFLNEFRIAHYVPDLNDCDDFTFAAVFFMQLLHRRGQVEHPPHRRTALAFGEFWYRRDIGGMHAINLALVRSTNNGPLTTDNGPYAPVFFEPQTQTIVTLTQKEIQSCDTIRF